MLTNNMLELVLRDGHDTPSVERLDGPRVRLTFSQHESLESAMLRCRDDLFQAIEWALTSLYNNEEAPTRVFVRDANGQEMLMTSDPCAAYGLQAIIRP